MAELVLLTTLLLLIPLMSSTPITTRDIGSCHAEWVKFEHSCYKLITERHRWYDAQTVCKSLDGSLVNIGSKQEDEFVRKIAHKKGVSAWIGLSDLVQEGHFVWTDTQEDPKYTNWLKEQPDNYGGKEDCAVLWYQHKGKWNDASCENKNAAICEKHPDDVDDADDVDENAEVVEEENVE